MIVALALPRFREHALIGGGWRLDGGASLPTYFMGACLYIFPNEFRKRRVYQQKHARALRGEAVKLEPVVNVVSTSARWRIRMPSARRSATQGVSYQMLRPAIFQSCSL
jgi:hypothetical protein